VRFAHGADSGELVRPVDFGIRWDVASTEPLLVQSEHRAFVAFYLDPDDEAEVGVIEWIGRRGAVLGGLNDEAGQGHPLWAARFDADVYGGFEVVNSQWIRDWERANRVRLRHDRARFAAVHHWLLGFHDSTFECVARGWVSYRADGPRDAAVVELGSLVLDHARQCSERSAALATGLVGGPAFRGGCSSNHAPALQPRREPGATQG
jgi:hypothetical protein